MSDAPPPPPSEGPSVDYAGKTATTVVATNQRINLFAENVARERDASLAIFNSLSDDLKAIDDRVDEKLKLIQDGIDAIDARAKQRYDRLELQLRTLSSAVTTSQTLPPDPSSNVAPLNPFLQDGGFAPKGAPTQRHTDGRINLQYGTSVRADKAYTLMDLRLKEAFPAMVLAGDYYCPEASARSKVTFQKEHRLTMADATVLDKLEKIQVILRTAMIPYEMWPARVVLELSGDFAHVARWALNNQPSWPLLVEAILQVLGEHNALHATITVFSTMLPFKDEAYINFAWRVRDAYYKLSQTQQNAPIIRSILLEKISTNMPSVYAEVLDRISIMTTPMIVEELVRRAKVHTNKSVERSIYASPQTTVQLQGASAPFYELQVGPATGDKPGTVQIKPPDAVTTQTTISDPRTEERAVHPVGQAFWPPDASDGGINSHMVAAANEKDNKCFNCGKQGHWAKDCRSKPNWPKTTQPQTGGRPVTLKGTLYDDQRPNLTSRLRNTISTWRNKGPGQRNAQRRKGPRVHMVDPEPLDDEDRRDPVSRLDDDDDVDELLRDIFNDLGVDD